MAKNLDGIKKLSPDELKKSREIVLDYIGEKEVKSKAQPNAEKSVEPIKKVDGVRLNPKADSNKPRASQPKKQIEAWKKAEDQESEVNRAELEKIKAEAEEERLNMAIKKQAEERKRLKEEERQFELNKIAEEKRKKFLAREKIRQEEEKKHQQEMDEKRRQEEKLKREKDKVLNEKRLKQELEEKARQLEREKKRVEEERIEREKEKARQEELLKKQAEDREKKLLAKQEKEKRRIRRAKQIKKFKEELRGKLVRGCDYVLAKKKILIYIILSLVIIFIGGYLIFGLLLINFRVDNSFSRKIAAYLPVPVLITNIGMVGYYDYKDTVDLLAKDAIVNNQMKQTAKKNLIKNLVFNQLAKKYSFDLKANEAEKKLADKVILDRQINQTAIFRVEKIYSLLSQDNDFEKVKIYADEYFASSNFSHEAALENFGQDINSLAVGQLSYIIPASQGYYIIRVNDEADNNLNITYLFVKAKTLDDYVNQELAKIKIFSLVDR